MALAERIHNPLTQTTAAQARIAALENLDFDEIQRRREWNRGPLKDFLPKIPADALERVLDHCISKFATYDLSESKHWNARRFSAIVVAFVRHNYTEYDSILKQGVEQFEARKRTGPEAWKVLRKW
jgi:hypothetical protein